MSANYNEPLTLGDDVYTVADFRESVRCGMFIDYDGFGYPVKDGKCDSKIWVQPSKVEEIPEDATHVVWFNK